MNGFTLLELLASLLIIALLSSGMMVGVGYWQMHSQQQVQIHTLQQDILVAEQAARRYQTAVTLCPISANKVCGDDWSKGRQAFYYLGQKQYLLVKHQYSLKSAHWLWRSSLAKNDRLIFAAGDDNLSQQGSFYYCSHYMAKHFATRIVINQMGRMYTRHGQYENYCGDN